MKTVWKYELEKSQMQVIEVPKGFKPLSIQLQERDELFKPALWCLVDSEADYFVLRVLTVHTGAEMPSGAWEYLSTYQHQGQVYHVFLDLVSIPIIVDTTSDTGNKK